MDKRAVIKITPDRLERPTTYPVCNGSGGSNRNCFRSIVIAQFFNEIIYLAVAFARACVLMQANFFCCITQKFIGLGHCCNLNLHG